MAEQQLKAKITADAQGLKQAVAEGEASLKNLKNTAEQAGKATQSAMNTAASGAGKAGSALGKAGSAMSQMGAISGTAGKAISGTGQIIGQVASGPIGAFIAGTTVMIGIINRLSDMLKTNAAAWQEWKAEMLAADKEAQAWGMGEFGKNGQTISTLQSLEGIAIAQENGSLTPDQELQKETILQTLRKQDEVLARELEAEFEGKNSRDALTKAVKKAQEKQLRNLEYVAERIESEKGTYEAELESAKTLDDKQGIKAANDKIRNADERLSKIREQRAALEKTDLAQEMATRLSLRQRSINAKAGSDADAWLAGNAGAAQSPSQKLAAMVAAVEAEAEKARQNLKKSGAESDDARFKKIEEIRVAKLQDIYENEAKRRGQAAGTLQGLFDEELSERKSYLDKILSEQEKAVAGWKSANSNLQSASQNLASIKQDITNKRAQENINGLNTKLASFGFSLPTKGGKYAKLDAGIAEKLAAKARGEDVDFSKKERRRIRDYRNTQRRRDKAVKKQEATQKKQAEAADKARLDAAQKQVIAAQTQKEAADRLLQAANALLGRNGGKEGAKAESNKIAQTQAARKKQRRENAKIEAAKNVGDTPKKKKRESIRTRRAREAREAKQAPPRTAPGVPASAANATRGGNEERLLGEINDKLGKKVYVVR